MRRIFATRHPQETSTMHMYAGRGHPQVISNRPMHGGAPFNRNGAYLWPKREQEARAAALTTIRSYTSTPLCVAVATGYS